MSAFTNRYTFLYVTILVLIITVLLTGVYFGTKERQDANRTLENASQILKAAGYGVDKTQVQKLFEEVTEIKKTENGLCPKCCPGDLRRRQGAYQKRV